MSESRISPNEDMVNSTNGQRKGDPKKAEKREVPLAPSSVLPK